MRKLIVQQYVTLDSIAAEEDGGLSFIPSEPYSLSTDEDFKTSAFQFLNTVDTMILGAHTYTLFKEYWPDAQQEGEFGEKLNKLTKIIASRKLNEAPWGNFPNAVVTSNPVATILELKQNSGKDIVLWGSLTLMQSMLDAGVVDEIQLRVCPATRGRGRHMFTDRHEVTLIETQTFKNGIVLLRYSLVKEG